MVETILWRRLDVPGHDACRLQKIDAGWMLEGTSVSLEESVVIRLNYQVRCDDAWRSTDAEIDGWLGARPVAIRITHTAGGDWVINGNVVDGLNDCIDLDLGFTPSTNTLALRRLNLADGQAEDAPAAWLDVFQERL